MVNVDKIKALAKLRGLKLAYLCAQMNEDPTYFDKLKKGLRSIDAGRIEFLAEALGTTVNYLTDQTDDPTVTKETTSAYRISPIEKALIEAYRAHPEMWPGIHAMLGIKPDKADADAANAKTVSAVVNALTDAEKSISTR